MSVTVANASPLIALARVDQFHLFKHLFQSIVIPEAVWLEVVTRGTNKPAADLVVQAEQEGWLRRQPIQDDLAATVLQATLGAGEAEAIILAQEMQAAWLLLDDDLGRSHASRLGLSIKGSAGILLAAYQANLITDLQKVLDELRSKSFRLSDGVYNAILAQAGKIP